MLPCIKHQFRAGAVSRHVWVRRRKGGREAGRFRQCCPVVPSHGLAVGRPRLAVGTRVLLQACVGAGYGKGGGSRLNRQILDICTSQSLCMLGVWLLQGGNLTVRETALDVSPALLPLIPCSVPAAKPWVDTTAGWRTGLLSQWFGLGLFLKCSCNRNGSKSLVIWITSEEAAWEGERGVWTRFC